MQRLILSLVLILFSNSSYSAGPENTIAKAVATTRKSESLQQLPKEKSELLKKAIDSYKAKLKPIDDKTKAARKELKDLLSSEAFNTDEYIKKSDELAKLESDKSTLKSGAIAELAPKFIPSERKIMLKSFNAGKKTKPTKKPKT